jgi:UTP--glucose-1-phosphate uridylyltransferase
MFGYQYAENQCAGNQTIYNLKQHDKKAVIPAAGLGTRFCPPPRHNPKKMLPIIDTPTIQYVVQEAVDSGIEDILIISGRNKRAMEDHFDRNAELEERLTKEEKETLFNEIRHIADMANIHYVRQKKFGTWGCNLLRPGFIQAMNPCCFARRYHHQFGIPVTQQLIDVYEQYQATTVAVEVVPKDKVSRYGIVGGKKLSDHIMEVDTFVEKPSIKEAPSNLAIAGRYILTPEIYKALEQTQEEKITKYN